MTVSDISPSVERTVHDRHVRIESVRVLGRHRRTLGDVEGLARSIEEIGLINPITLTLDGQLVAGERRLAAARLLGWETIPARWVSTLDDAAERLHVERDENLCRLDMAPSELASLGAALEEIHRPSAEESHRQGSARGGQAQGLVPENQALATRPVDTAVKVADALGVSKATYVRARAVHQAATDPELPEPERQRAQEALDAMDQTGQVKPAYDAWKSGSPLPEPKKASTPGATRGRNRSPLPDALRRGSLEAVKAAERLERLVLDDRFPQYAEQAARMVRSDLLRAADLLATVIGRIPNLDQEAEPSVQQP